MNKLVEQLKKERLPVHPKCLGQGFSDEEKKFLKFPQCRRIDKIEIFEILDEESGEIDDEVAPIVSDSDPECRCKVYVNPSIWWNAEGKRCPMGDHFRPDLDVKVAKGRIGQQKQSKKKLKKKK